MSLAFEEELIEKPQQQWLNWSEKHSSIEPLEPFEHESVGKGIFIRLESAQKNNQR